MNVDTIAQRIIDAGGRPFLVGGAVRDELLGRPPRDVDIEVLGLAPDVVASLFPVEFVGASYDVLRVGDVDVTVSDAVNFTEAAFRRDFTVNAIGRNLKTGRIVDPLNGARDLQNGLLCTVSGHVFTDDPLRVFRAARFIAELGFTPTQLTLWDAEVADTSGVAPERLFAELQKLILAPFPSRGLEFLRSVGHLPELLARMGDTPQDPRHHPEGDVLTHTGLCLDAYTGTDPVVAWAILLHDCGKPDTTEVDGDRVTSFGHAAEGARLAFEFLVGLRGMAGDDITAVCGLIADHMFPADASRAAVRRLARRCGSIEKLVATMRADRAGRPPFPAEPDFGAELLLAAEAEGVRSARPVPIVMGRHLLDLGWEPGPAVGDELGRLFEAQLDGAFTDLAGGLAMVGICKEST